MKPTKLAAAASTAAVAAAAAYAVGTQQSGGSAQAAGASPAAATYAASTASSTAARGFGRGLSSAADALGVSESALRTALQELRAEQDPRPGGKADLAAALANALGRTEAQVTAAFEAVRQDGAWRRGRGGNGLAAALAAELDVSAERVRTALAAAHEARHAARRREQAAALARELGIDAARVQAALEELRPATGARPDRRGPGDLTEELAGELGIAEERVDEALDALRAAHRAEREARARQFADRLAAELKISQAKVRELVAEGGLLGGRGHGGRGGRPGGGRP